MQVGCGDVGQALDFQDSIYEAEKIDVPSHTYTTHGVKAQTEHDSDLLVRTR